MKWNICAEVVTKLSGGVTGVGQSTQCSMLTTKIPHFLIFLPTIAVQSKQFQTNKTEVCPENDQKEFFHTMNVYDSKLYLLLDIMPPLEFFKISLNSNSLGVSYTLSNEFSIPNLFSDEENVFSCIHAEQSHCGLESYLMCSI